MITNSGYAALMQMFKGMGVQVPLEGFPAT
jgi:hypothetical protein